jgi:hypothetical protein
VTASFALAEKVYLASRLLPELSINPVLVSPQAIDGKGGSARRIELDVSIAHEIKQKINNHDLNFVFIASPSLHP